MSSTNRGGQREVSDYYKTPETEIERFLTAWTSDLGGPDCLRHVRNILDPCAGGTIGREGMSYPRAIVRLKHLFPNLGKITTNDIRQDSPADYQEDYLEMAAPCGCLPPGGQPFVIKPELIITNPPFCLAREIIEKALRDVGCDVNCGGYVVMLLRLNFLGTQGRLPFWQAHPPQRIYVHSQRMQFNLHRNDLPKKIRNGTDSIEYAHFVWWTGHQGNTSELRVI